jgi:FkbM family methyltransferase
MRLLSALSSLMEFLLLRFSFLDRLYQKFLFGKIMFLIFIKVEKGFLSFLMSGANIGELTSEYNRFFPEANVYSFEPTSSTFATLERKCSGRTNVHLHQLALSDFECTAKIALMGDNQENRLMENETDINHSESQEVKVTTIDAFCTKHNIDNIDILKTDVEGFDFKVLLGAKKLLKERRVKYIISEVGFRHLPDKGDFILISDYLHKSGYCLSGFYDNYRWGKGKMYLKFSNALFRRYDI